MEPRVATDPRKTDRRKTTSSACSDHNKVILLMVLMLDPSKGADTTHFVRIWSSVVCTNQSNPRRRGPSKLSPSYYRQTQGRKQSNAHNRWHLTKPNRSVLVIVRVRRRSYTQTAKPLRTSKPTRETHCPPAVGISTSMWHLNSFSIPEGTNSFPLLQSRSPCEEHAEEAALHAFRKEARPLTLPTLQADTHDRYPEKARAGSCAQRPCTRQTTRWSLQEILHIGIAARGR